MASRELDHPANFTMRRDPMTAFVEVPFSGDEHYRGIEIHRLQPDRDRTGFLVLLTTKAGRLEGYIEGELGLDDAFFAHDAALSHMNAARHGHLFAEQIDFALTSSRLSVDLDFYSDTGRRIQLALAQPITKSSRRGDHSPMVPQAAPTLMRFMSTEDFDLLDARKASVSVKVAGRQMSPLTAPLRISGGRRHRLLARYARDVSLVALCPPVGQFRNDQLEWVHHPDSCRAILKRVNTQFDAVFSPGLGSATKLQAGTLVLSHQQQRVARASYTTHTSNGRTEVDILNLRQRFYPPAHSPRSLMTWAQRAVRRRRTAYDWTATPHDPSGSWLRTPSRQ